MSSRYLSRSMGFYGTQTAITRISACHVCLPAPWLCAGSGPDLPSMADEIRYTPDLVSKVCIQTIPNSNFPTGTLSYDGRQETGPKPYPIL
ncbi:hypothetical protein V2G26_009194 [Clonostachys chloroleuca]